MCQNSSIRQSVESRRVRDMKVAGISNPPESRYHPSVLNTPGWEEIPAVVVAGFYF
jgi:hypothetical protein